MKFKEMLLQTKIQLGLLVLTSFVTGMLVSNLVWTKPLEVKGDKSTSEYTTPKENNKNDSENEVEEEREQLKPFGFEKDTIDVINEKLTQTTTEIELIEVMNNDLLSVLNVSVKGSTPIEMESMINPEDGSLVISADIGGEIATLLYLTQEELVKGNHKDVKYVADKVIGSIVFNMSTREERSKIKYIDAHETYIETKDENQKLLNKYEYKVTNEGSVHIN